MQPPPPDWQLPDGVNRGLWDYLHDPGIARGYDAGLASSSLFRVDLAFVDEHCPAAGRLLDLGCGTGRLLVHRARRGDEVLGVDLSAAMLAVARERAEQEGVPVALARANLTDLAALPDGHFDCAACLFSTLGMVVGADARRRAVAEAFRVLVPGGRFVLHIHNRWFNFWDPAGRRWLARDTLRALFTATPGGDRLMPPHQGVAGLTLHLFTRGEVVRLLRGAGFRILEARPISLRPDGRLNCPAWLGWLRAYGYLIAAQKPAGVQERAPK
jgi:SAM-dependent methyltransferase